MSNEEQWSSFPKLVVLVGPAITTSADSASYLLSALSLALIPHAFNQSHLREGGARPWLRNPLGDIREGLHFLWGHTLVQTPQEEQLNHLTLPDPHKKDAL